MAILAAILHISSTTESLSMRAASIAGPGLNLDEIGLLYLCHESDAPLPETGKAGNAPPPCPICQTVQMTGQGLSPSAPHKIEPPRLPIARIILAAFSIPTLPPLLRYGTTRGPPAILSA
jgi:hypothetical protein